MTRMTFTAAPADSEADIVIVGAGVSGLYCAWRLLEHDPKLRITIVERLNRTGGRLDTDIIEIRPGELVREEEGGMRFSYGMTELMQLLYALGLCDQIVDFPMSSAVEVDGREVNTNRFYLRGRRFTADEAQRGGNRIWSEIYRLAPEEQGLSPTDLVGIAYNAVLNQNRWQPPAVQTPEFWTTFRETATWNGVAMKDWQLWGLLREMGRSEECIQMLSESIGFAGPFKAPINAGDAFQILADFPKDPSYHTFVHGFGTLPDTLADRLAGRARIVLGTNVDAIVRKGQRFALTLTEAPPGCSSNPHVAGGQTKTLTADKVIVAVATSGMERLFITSPALNADPGAPKLWDQIHAARGMKLMKINLYFEHPWWENGTLVQPPVRFGPNFTSLPVNAVYPFYSLAGDKRPAARRVALSAEEQIPDKAAALTIYCDFDSTNFWAGLQNVGARFDSPLQKQQQEKRPQTLYAASWQVVNEARRQLAEIFGIAEVPLPVLTSYRLWDGNDDFEYAYHQWRVGVADSEVRAYLSNPIDGVYFCNEAISDMQGWVNGSLRSSNLVLQHFGIAPMSGPACQAAPPARPARALRATGLWGS